MLTAKVIAEQCREVAMVFRAITPKHRVGAPRGTWAAAVVLDAIAGETERLSREIDQKIAALPENSA